MAQMTVETKLGPSREGRRPSEKKLRKIEHRFVYIFQTSEHSIEKVGSELRAMMPWIAQNKIVDKAKN